MRIAPSDSLPRERRADLRSDRGSALFLLLILAVVMASVLGGVFSYISVQTKAEKRSNVRLEGTYAAEYAFEQAYQQLNALISQSTANLPDVSATSGATNLTKAPTQVFGTTEGYTWKAFITIPVEDGAPVAAHSNFDPTQGVYKFMTIAEFERTVPGMPAPVHMQFQREWNYSLTPLFQYAVFYNTDMELFPGAAFNVGGRVHSNGRIYTGTTASITFQDFVTHVNGVSNQYSPLDPRTRGTLGGPVTYVRSTPLMTTAKNPPGQLNANTTDANVNNDGSRELIEIPNAWQTDDNATERMYNKAGVKVIVNTGNAAIAADNGLTVPANSTVFLTADGTVIPATDPLGVYLDTLVSTGSFKDYREGATFTTTDVDISRVTTAYNDGGLPQVIPTSNSWPNNNTVPAALKGKAIPVALRGKSLWNGVMYVSDLSNSASHRTGVKLTNGGSLPDGSETLSPTAGLTIATNNAAFLIGDFNTGGSPPVNTSSSLTADNHTASYVVQPASVIADAVTVVSSNWTSGSYDSKSTLSQRTATNTTINAAIISGIVASDGTAYSGGVENFIRLLEDWGGRRLTYYGSMVNVYPSQQSTAHWQQTGNYYQAPSRNWYFDVNFLNPNKLPPGTPVIRTLMRGQWVQIE